MKEYLCILGRHPKLSLLELVSYCKRKHINCQLKHSTATFAHVALASPLNIHELGGIQKIAEPTTLDALVPNRNKITFAITSVDSKNILPQIKARWKEERVKAMQKYASMRTIPPSKSRLLDLDIIVYRNIPYKVTAVSDPRAYRKRDETRPSFDALKVTSIRLAKMLVNLAQAEKSILDPFCGNGTILQEALLMGYEVVGIDLSIASAKKNISWLGERYRKRAHLLQGDAPATIASLPSVEAVATEPYMGPYVKKLPTEEQAQRIVSGLIPLYERLFSALAKVQGKVVIVLPRIRTFKKTFSLPVHHLLKKTGFTISSIHPSIHLPIVYEKRRSKVERLIYVVEKLK